MPTYSQIIYDAFSRANTVVGSGANSTNVGSPDAFYPPAITGSWKDLDGDCWLINNNQLLPSGGAPGSGTYPNLAMLYRTQTGDLGQNQKIVVVFETDANSNTSNYIFSLAAFLHVNSNFAVGSGFGVEIGSNFFRVGYTTNLVFATAGTGNTVTFANNIAGATGSGGKLLPNTRFVLSLEAYNTGTNATYLIASIAPTITGTAFGSIAGDAATLITALPTNNHAAGGYGVGFRHWNNNPNLPSFPKIISIDCSLGSNTPLAVNAPSIQAGSTSQGLILTSSTATDWLTTPPTFTLSGVAGVTRTAGDTVVALSNTVAMINLDVTLGSTGTLTITQGGTGDTTTCSVIAANGASPTVPMAFIRDSSSFDGISFVPSPAYGGKGPYTYALRRQVTAGAGTTTAYNGAGWTEVATGLVPGVQKNYTPPDSRPALYKIVATDASTNIGASLAHLMITGYAAPVAPSLVASPAFVPKTAYFMDSYGRNSQSGTTIPTRILTYMQTAFPGATTGINTSSSGKRSFDFMYSGYTEVYNGNTVTTLNYYSVTALPSTETSATVKAGLTSVGAGLNQIFYSLGFNDASYHDTYAEYYARTYSILSLVKTDFPSVQIVATCDTWSPGDCLRNDHNYDYMLALWQLSQDNAALFVHYPAYFAQWLMFNTGELYDTIHPSDVAGVAAAKFFATALSTAATSTGTIASIAIDQGSSLRVYGGATYQLTKTITPLSGTPSELVSWTVRSGVGTVGLTGIYTAPGANQSIQVSVVRVTAVDGQYDEISITTPVAGSGDNMADILAVSIATLTGTAYDLLITGAWTGYIACDNFDVRFIVQASATGVPAVGATSWFPIAGRGVFGPITVPAGYKLYMLGTAGSIVRLTAAA